ncbi:hypothetical protein AB0J43_33445, partial [Nonomuraea fuscirosea]
MSAGHEVAGTPPAKDGAEPPAREGARRRPVGSYAAAITSTSVSASSLGWSAAGCSMNQDV